MALTAEQKKWLETYVKRHTPKDPKSLSHAARLAAERNTEPGILQTDAGSKIEATLKQTGRIDDPLDATATREEKREAHLQDILLKDEDGLNASLIAAKAKPVDAATRKLARKVIDENTSNADRLLIEAARAQMVDARGAEEYTQEQLLALKQAQLLASSTTTAREATDVSLQALATTEGNVGLSHHASRHGPQTTVNDHVTRIATGFPPDKKDAAAAGTSPFATQTGEQVNVPNSRATGDEASNTVSWIGSGQAGLNMVEDALSKARQSQASGAINVGDRLVTDTKVGVDEPSFGHTAAPRKTGPTSYVDKDGHALPSSNQLSSASKTADQKQEVIKKRAEAVRVERNIRGAKVITDAMPDGSFRTVTAYPDASVNADAFGLSTGQHTAPTAKNLAGEAAAAAQRKVDKANQDAIAAADRRNLKKVDAEAQNQVAMDAIRASLDAAAAVPEAKTELADLQLAAREQLAAHNRRDRAGDAKVAALARQTELAQTLIDKEAGMAGLESDHKDRKQEAGADRASKPKAIAYRRARELHEQAESLLERSKAIKTSVDSDVLSITAEFEAAKLAVTAADAKFAEARVRAEQKVPGSAQQKAQAAQKAIDTARTMLTATAEAKALTAQLNTLTRQAALATSLATEAAELHESAGDKSAAAPDVADVAAERLERQTALKDALNRSPAELQQAKDDWASDIDAVAMMLAEDQANRGRAQAAAEARAALAVQEAEKLRAALNAARQQLQKLVAQKAATGQTEPAAEKVKQLEEKIAAHKLTVERHKQDRAQGRRLNQLRERADAANLALARSTLAAAAARVEAEKAIADGAPDAVLKTRRAEASEAQEVLNRLSAEHEAHVGARREAARAQRAAVVIAGRQTALLAQRQKDVADAETAAAQVGGPAVPDDIVRLRDVLIPQVLTLRKDAADAQVSSSDTLLKDADKALSDCDKAMGVATKALQSAQAALKLVEPKASTKKKGR